MMIVFSVASEKVRLVVRDEITAFVLDHQVDEPFEETLDREEVESVLARQQLVFLEELFQASHREIADREVKSEFVQPLAIGDVSESETVEITVEEIQCVVGQLPQPVVDREAVNLQLLLGLVEFVLELPNIR